MSKKQKNDHVEKHEKQEEQEMTLAEAKAYRASLYKAEKKELTVEEKKEQFRIFWAQQKHKYGKAKDLEQILWVHLKATKHDEPEKFEAGLAHFGLKKVR